ncbi:MAG: sugar phosphate nucleotidyltransferase, partial [Bacillota bacterium]|nr:sugar phosphate nucleotidyltransferase [Bacillota bacterium]
MKAVLMAGGEGSRLRPLTVALPKPLVPVVNRPVMEHILRHMAGYGFDQAVVTLHTLPGAIRSYFGRGPWHGIDLDYSTEVEPLGTAGSVSLAARGWSE